MFCSILVACFVLFFFYRCGNCQKLLYIEEVNRFPFSNIYIDAVDFMMLYNGRV